MKWLALAALATTAGCTCVRTDGLVFECGPDGSCPTGLTCDEGLQLCLAGDGGGFLDAGADAGSDAGRDGGVDAGADAGRDGGLDGGSDGGADAGRDGGLDGGSDGGRDGGLDAGVDAGPSGETCSDPFPLDLSTGNALVTGTLTGTRDDVATTCMGFGSVSPGPDLVYAFDGGGVLDVDLHRTSGSSMWPELMVRTSCSAPTSTFCGLSKSDTPVVAHLLLPQGRWYLVVDCETQKGPYEMAVSLKAPVAGEWCENPLPLTLSGAPLTASTMVSLAGTEATRQRPPSCSDAGVGHDVVLKVTTPTTGNLSVVGVANFGFALAVTEGPSCPSASEPAGACGADGDGGQLSLNVPGALAGTYWVWVSSTSAAGQGTVDLTVTLQ
ncbi:MAG: hypothetical protein K1X89_08095 [Myxococcaceae bacterium]|nr:hypothetical protein [Myxococcaceae bacterium]